MIVPPRCLLARSSLIAGVLGLASSLLVVPAYGAGVVGTGTAASCTDAAFDAALAGGGLVTFNCGGAITITVLTTKTISADTTINGGNLVTLSGGGVRRVFSVGPVPLRLQSLTVASGDAGASSGGAVENGGSLTVTNSTFSGNSGGAIANIRGGTLDIANSTFSGNSSTGLNVGGAIDNRGGTVTIVNSTFHGNSALGGRGGAIYGAGGFVLLRNVTISGNTAATSGGGFFDNVDNSEAYNSIIANNAPNNCGGDPFPSAARFNVVSDASCGSSVAGGTGNQINTNPQLAPLANNGGFTQTMALNPGSPAIDAGSPNAVGTDACLATDQRGTLRPLGVRCDVGAFEAAAVVVVIVPTAPRVIPTLSGWVLLALTGMVGLWGSIRLRRR